MQTSVARDRADGSEVESAPGTGVPATLETGEARPHTEKSGCPYAAAFDSSTGISKSSEAGAFDPDQLENEEPGYGLLGLECWPRIRIVCSGFCAGALPS